MIYDPPPRVNVLALALYVTLAVGASALLGAILALVD